MFYVEESYYNSDSVYAFYPEYALLRVDLYPNRSVDFKKIIEVKNRKGGTQSITGVIEGEILEFRGSRKGIPLNLSLVDGPNGIVEISIDSADVVSLRRSMYVYQIRAIDGEQTSLISHGQVVFTDL